MNIFETLAGYFQFPFVRYALIAGVLIALCSSLLGVTQVLKRFSFIGDGLSHVAFGAMAIATVVNVSNDMLIVMPVTILSALLLLRKNGTKNVRGDAALAMAYASQCNANIQFLLSRIEMLTMQSCRGKLLAFLLAEKREDGVILLRGSRDELASRLSVSRAALYRELSALQSGGYLEVGESRLRVLNTSALERLLYGV